MSELIGWDISSNLVGVCVLDKETGSTKSMDFLDLRKIESEYERINKFEEFAYNVGMDGQTIHIVEERLAGFTRGFTSMQTLMKLAAINFACSWILSREGSVRKLHPSTIKAIMKREGLVIPKGSDKKKLTLDFVIAKEPMFKDIVSRNLNRNDKPQPYCFDMADSYIVARAGYMKENEQARKVIGN